MEHTLSEAERFLERFKECDPMSRPGLLEASLPS